VSAKINCKDVSRLISEGFEKKLPHDEAMRLRLHFVICSTCRDVNEQMSFLRGAMQRLGKDAPDGGQEKP
jgi:hypothetical protein